MNPKPNIFAISPRISLEDRFTESLAYMFGTCPPIAQKFIDRLCNVSWLRRSKYVSCETQPALSKNGANRPDLLIRTRDYSLLIENKIDSPLGNRQLERYLALAGQNQHKLVLITREQARVSSFVRSSPRFVKPRSKDRHNFLWSDFYVVFEEQKSRLAREFAEWMDLLGMNPYIWPAVGDPFGSPSIAEQLGKAIFKAARYFGDRPDRPPFQRIQVTNDNLACQIQKALPGVHLLFLQILKRPNAYGDFEPKQRAVLSIDIMVNRTRNNRRCFPKKDYSFRTAVGTVDVHWDDDPMNWNPKLFCELNFSIGLKEMLGKSFEDAEKNMRTIFECISERIVSRRVE